MSAIIKIIIFSLALVFVGGVLMFIKRKEATRYHCSTIWIIGVTIMTLGLVPLFSMGMGAIAYWILM